MPPRFAYWTILIDGKPTAFRARDQQELLPTFNQLKRTNKDVLLRWFARGKLWESPDAERASWRKPKPAQARGRDWRPGGRHEDPRQHFRDEKKRRNQERRAERHERTHAKPSPAPPWSGKPRENKPPPDAREGKAGERRPWSGKPRDQKPRDRKPWSGKPRGEKPWSGKPRGDRPWTGKPRERKPWSGKPRGQKPWSGKSRDEKPWRDKPPRGRFPPRDVDARASEAPRRADEGAPPPKKRESPDQPPPPEQIVIKPEPPERG